MLKNIDIGRLSEYSALNENLLTEIAKETPYHYYAVDIPKKSGGNRRLDIPYPNLKKAQKLLLKKIFNKIPTHPYLYGKPGDSIKKAIKNHVKKEVVITMDIKDFFPNTKAFMIKRALERNGLTANASEILTRIVTCNNHLPQGAPTSPCIGRIVLDPFAKELGKLFLGIPMTSFSIYFDDITISGPKSIKGYRSTIGKMLERYGYMVNKNKTKIMYRNQDQNSLNIRLNNRIEARKEYIEEIKKLEKELHASDPRLLGKKAYFEYYKFQ